jgi:membrane protease subunit HflC
MEAYRHAFGDGKSTLIVKPDDPFLQYFQSSAGKR